MLGQRSAVCAALTCRSGLALGITGLGLRGLGSLHLLNVFQGQLELIDGHRLGPAAEAVALHLLDDLTEPLGLGVPLGEARGVGGALGEHDRLERFWIVWKGVRQGRHRQELEHIQTRLRRPRGRGESSCRR